MVSTRAMFLAVGALALAVATPVGAQTATFAVLGDAVDLTVGDDGRATGSLTLLNLTTASPRVTITASGPADCSVSPTETTLSPGQQASVSLTLTGCRAEGADGIEITLSNSSTTIEVTAAVADDADPALALARVVLRRRRRRRGDADSGCMDEVGTA